ncbi:diadenosine tetraphosphate (Ap4A) HIT family hydrolase [Saccharothrix carnea]|uniref:Diadenosine tetraphosphate (Ap4A) HIT family hydrolase n=1 Tax=Saccharothrix carnea TaxID=1280637 RepID=A0A2P8IAP6_SACCR|nr:HIT family protein [Saccharothrix carnea]PSL55530.1 diadenosine tetraphosphate (Ap4A) HIT family hydrolase [Saccharothrix carnea]
MAGATQCTGADFCEEISGAIDTAFNRFYDGDPPSRRVYSTENFELLADMSPLTAGHLLLLPKKHYLSFAQVLTAYPGETEDLVQRIVEIYAETFRQPLVMEHGSGPGQDDHACITHAHLHLLPVDGDAVDDLLLRDGLAYQDLNSISELAQDPWPGASYFLRLFNGRCRVYLPTVQQKRQYLRSVAGAVLSIEDPEWDYAVVMRKDDLRSTMRMVEHWSARLSYVRSDPGA